MIMGIALPYVMAPVMDSACKMPTDADEDWTMAVSTVPASTPKIGLENIRKIFAKSGMSFSGATASDMVSMPNINTENPSRIMPVSLRFCRLENMLNPMPTAAMTGVNVAGLKIVRYQASPVMPAKDKIHAVTAVPTLAPMMMPTVCSSFITPEFTKPTTITVVAEED